MNVRENQRDTQYTERKQAKPKSKS